MGRLKITQHACKRCGILKPREEFPLDRRGFLARPYCKPCERARKRENRAAKPKVRNPRTKPQPKPYVRPDFLTCRKCHQVKVAERFTHELRNGERRPTRLCKDCFNASQRVTNPSKGGRKKLKEKTCKWCGEVKPREAFIYSGYKAPATYCRSCHNAAQRAKRAKNKKPRPIRIPPSELTGRFCGFTGEIKHFASSYNKRGEKRYYNKCKACYNARQTEIRKPAQLSYLQRMRIKDRDHVRRALKAATMIEPFSFEDVITRDGLICYLCGGVVERDDASLDHVIPLKRGGPHTLENCHVTHLMCNLRKGKKLLSELTWYKPQDHSAQNKTPALMNWV